MTEKNNSIKQIIDFRIEKMKKIRELGIEPYPHRFDPSHKSVEILSNFDMLENQKMMQLKQK